MSSHSNVSTEPPKMMVTREHMSEQYLPLHGRDYCAHKLVPLNHCRRENFYMPWTCHHERHDYEVCLYNEYQRRQAMYAEVKAEKKAAQK
jgi:NADH dehydrogenase (ubiquinone) 1 beta subcomplex subunit 7